MVVPFCRVCRFAAFAVLSFYNCARLAGLQFCRFRRFRRFAFSSFCGFAFPPVCRFHGSAAWGFSRVCGFGILPLCHAPPHIILNKNLEGASARRSVPGGWHPGFYLVLYGGAGALFVMRNWKHPGQDLSRSLITDLIGAPLAPLVRSRQQTSTPHACRTAPNASTTSQHMR